MVRVRVLLLLLLLTALWSGQVRACRTWAVEANSVRGTRRRPALRSGWARGASSALRSAVVVVVVAAAVKAEVVAAVSASAPRAPADSPVRTRCGPPPSRVSLSSFSPPPPKTPKTKTRPKTRWKTWRKTTMGAGVLMWEGAPLLCCSRLPAAERASVFCAQGTTPPPPTPQRRCSSSGRTQRERKRARKRPFEGRRQVKSRVLARPPRPACPPRPRCPPSGPLRSTPPTTAAAAAAAAPSPYLLTCLVLCPYPAPSRCGLGRSTFATMRRAPLGGASSSLLLLAVLLLGAGAAHAAVVAVERTLPARADVFLIGGEPFALEAGATFTVDITTTVRAPAVDACVRPRSRMHTHTRVLTTHARWSMTHVRGAALNRALPVHSLPPRPTGMLATAHAKGRVGKRP